MMKHNWTNVLRINIVSLMFFVNTFYGVQLHDDDTFDFIPSRSIDNGSSHDMAAIDPSLFDTAGSVLDVIDFDLVLCSEASSVQPSSFGRRILQALGNTNYDTSRLYNAGGEKIWESSSAEVLTADILNDCKKVVLERDIMQVILEDIGDDGDWVGLKESGYSIKDNGKSYGYTFIYFFNQTTKESYVQYFFPDEADNQVLDEAGVGYKGCIIKSTIAGVDDDTKMLIPEAGSLVDMYGTNDEFVDIGDLIDFCDTENSTLSIEAPAAAIDIGSTGSRIPGLFTEDGNITTATHLNADGDVIVQTLETDDNGREVEARVTKNGESIYLRVLLESPGIGDLRLVIYSVDISEGMKWESVLMWERSEMSDEENRYSQTINIPLGIAEFVLDDFDVDQVKDAIISEYASGGLRFFNFEYIVEGAGKMSTVDISYNNASDFSFISNDGENFLLDGLLINQSNLGDLIACFALHPSELRSFNPRGVLVTFGGVEYRIISDDSTIAIRNDSGRETTITNTQAVHSTAPQVISLIDSAGEPVATAIVAVERIMEFDDNGSPRAMVLRRSQVYDLDGNIIGQRIDTFIENTNDLGRSSSNIIPDVEEMIAVEFNNLLTSLDDSNVNGEFTCMRSMDVTYGEDSVAYDYYQIVEENGVYSRINTHQTSVTLDGDGGYTEVLTYDGKEIWQKTYHANGELISATYYDYLDDHVITLEGGKILVNGAALNPAEQWKSCSDEELFNGENRDILRPLLKEYEDNDGFRGFLDQTLASDQVEEYTFAKYFKVTMFEENGVKTGIIYNTEKEFTVGYFSYHNDELIMWEANGSYRYKASSDRPGSYEKERMRYGSLNITHPDQEDIEMAYSAFQLGVQRSAYSAYLQQSSRQQGVMEGIMMKVMDLTNKTAGYFPTGRGFVGYYKKVGVINVNSNSGEAVFDFEWIPHNPNDDEMRGEGGVVVVQEAEDFLNRKAGDVIKVNNDFRVTYAMVAAAAAVVLTVVGDVGMLLLAKTLATAGIHASNILSAGVQLAFKALMTIPKFSNVVAHTLYAVLNTGLALSSIPGAGIVAGVAKGITAFGLKALAKTPHIVREIGYRILYPVIHPIQYVFNTARLMSYGVPLRLVMMLPGIARGDYVDADLEEVAHQIASGSVFSGAYSYVFGVFLPVIARGLRLIHLGFIADFAELVTPQNNPAQMLSSLKHYGAYAAAFAIQEGILEEGLYPLVLNAGLGGVETLARYFEGNLFWDHVSADLDMFRDFIVETVSESIGG
ncbi:MAG: hypothetical protein P9M06_05685 [Candidatus Saelkia tenebricola]|nr:hypothetical protein [Candidatus Saelkia tenebricola]